MKLKNICKQYKVSVSVLDAKLNNHASIWTDERLQQSNQIEVQNGDLYMRQRYDNGKYGSWRCVAKAEHIRKELENYSELVRA